MMRKAGYVLPSLSYAASRVASSATRAFWAAVTGRGASSHNSRYRLMVFAASLMMCLPSSGFPFPGGCFHKGLQRPHSSICRNVEYSEGRPRDEME